jgi:hypothetical protein
MLDGQIVFDSAEEFGGSGVPAHGDVVQDEATQP